MDNERKHKKVIFTMSLIFILLVSNSTLITIVEEVSAIPPPKIISVTHDAATALTTNDTLTVTLVGDPFNLATFDVGDVAVDVEMFDDGAHDDGLRWDGVYVGEYTIKKDDENGAHTITGHLKRTESLQSSKDATPDVIIDTQQPIINSVWHNANTTTLTAKDVLTVTLVGEANLTATFDLGTLETDISMNQTSPGIYKGNYTVEDGDDGTWTVIGYLDDSVTPRSSKDTTPDVVTDTALPWIKKVWHDANTTTLNTIDILTVTLVGDPNCIATFDIGIIAYDRPMNVITLGTYQGDYTVANGDDGNWTVTCYLKDGSSINKRNARPNVDIDTPSPDITSVTHDVNRILTTNDTFNVTLMGDPGMTAWFNIEKLGTLQVLVSKQWLTETDPGISGIYVGNYTIKDGDNGAWTVVGYLQNTTAAVTDPSKKDAVPDIAIDTESPFIDSVWWIADKSVLTTDDILMVYLWGDAHLTASFSVGNLPHAQEQEMTETTDTFYQGSYIIKDGDDGTWNVTGYLDDGVTPRSSKNATDKVLIDTVQPQIDIIWHNANESNPNNSLNVSDVLNVTLVGEVGCNATFDVGLLPYAQNLPMNETAQGIYTGNYTVKDGDDGTWVVIGYLNDSVTPVNSTIADELVVIGDVIAPNSPTNLPIMSPPEGNILKLSWEHDGSDLDHFKIHRSTDGESYTCINPNVDPIWAEGYTDINLEDMKIYYYYITACDEVPNESPPSNTMVAYPQDIQTPDSPVLSGVDNLLPTSPGNTLLITWEKVGEGERDRWGNPFKCLYNLYRSTTVDGAYERINPDTINGTIYTDTNLIDGVKYFYCVTALDEVPNESPRSNVMSRVPKDTRPPPLPQQSSGGFLTVERVLSGSALNLSWSASQANDVVGYNIYRSERLSFTPFVWVDTLGIQTHYQDTNLINGRDYWYLVTAFDEVPNESVNMTDIDIVRSVTWNYSVWKRPQDTKSPSTIKNLSIEALPTGNSLLLSWERRDEEVVNYSIYRSANAVDFEQIANVSGENASYIDHGLVNGILYHYYIIAFDFDEVDQVWQKSPSYVIESAIPQDITAPAAPIGLTVTSFGVDGELEFVWIANAEDDIAAYRIYRSVDNIQYELVTEVNDTRFIDKGLDNEILYYYKITSVDEVPNESGYSETVSAVPHFIPSPPSNLTVMPISTGNALNISWDSSEGDVVQYAVYRSVNDDFYEIVATVPFGTRNFIDRNLLDGIAYYYKISVSIRMTVNNGGSTYHILIESDRSMAAGAVPIDIVPPQAPLGLAVRIEGEYISLNWTLPEDSDVVSYNVYRSFDSESRGNLVASGITSTNWTDKNVARGQRYYYLVTAVDDAFNEGKDSAKVSSSVEFVQNGFYSMLLGGILVVLLAFLIAVFGLIFWRMKKLEVITSKEDFEEEKTVEKIFQEVFDREEIEEVDEEIQEEIEDIDEEIQEEIEDVDETSVAFTVQGKYNLKQNILGIVSAIMAFVSLALPWWGIESYSFYPWRIIGRWATMGGYAFALYFPFVLIIASGVLGLMGSARVGKRGREFLLASGILAILSLVLFAISLQMIIRMSLFYSDEYAISPYLSFGFWVALVAGVLAFIASLRHPIAPSEPKIKQNILGIVSAIMVLVSLALPWWVLIGEGLGLGHTSLYLWGATGEPMAMGVYAFITVLFPLAFIIISGVLGLIGSVIVGKRGKELLLGAGTSAIISVVAFAIFLQMFLAMGGMGLFYSETYDGYTISAYLSLGFWLALVAGVLAFIASLRHPMEPSETEMS